tara:strand:- start:12287 stop:12844 length:558 start_codon:yes stop_codon:yes gene_type:complete
MKFNPTPLEGLIVIEPKIFGDSRGYFFESYHKKEFSEAGINSHFVQDNQSLSSKGVLRGLHFQKKPYAQGKLITVIKGEILDVVVDLRKSSKTYKDWFSIKLNDKNKKFLWIPEGFAHGFLTLKDNTIFNYKCTNYYHSESESGVVWDDYDLNINWEFDENLNKNDLIISEKDMALPSLENLGFF